MSDRATPMPRRRRRAFAVLAAILSLLAADQLVLAFVLADGWIGGLRVAPFDPPLFSAVQLEAVARLREELRSGVPPDRPIRFDAELGWGHAPSSGSGEDRFDELGARIAARPSQRVRRSGAKRILVFGCSFSYGTELGATESWPAQLGVLRPELEIVNLAVPGYGLDQALLRWRRDGRELDADEVWLGFLPAAASRNVNRYRPALSHWSVTVAFKPRFSLDAEGGLVLVPHPAATLTELLRLCTDAGAFVAAIGETDAFVARALPAYLPEGAHWTHHLALGRIAWTLVDRLGRDAQTLLADERGEVFAVTRAIARTMAREVVAKGQRFVLLVLPGRDDLQRADAEGTAPWQALASAWREDGIEVVDASEALRAQGAPAADALWAPGGHYSAAGNAAVAQTMSCRW